MVVVKNGCSYPFICFIIAMYVHHLGFYCVLFSRFLIAKINVALQLTKLCLKIVTTTTATEYLFIRCQ